MNERALLEKLGQMRRILTGRRGTPKQRVREALRRGFKLPPSDLVGQVLFSSTETRRESGVDRDGSRNKYPKPHQSNRERERRLRQMGV